MNVVFFGASVTAQKDESGYVPVFKKMLLEDNNYNIIQKGFGSMHLNDAGLCKINEIIDLKPDVCFIDWFSTGFIATEKGYFFSLLDCLVRKLMLINCKICFLLFDQLDFCEKRLIMYKNVINYTEIYNNIDYIGLYNNENIEDLLRDDVHTNKKGALLYAETIYNYFSTNIININYNNLTLNNKIPEENEYFNIKTLEINKKITDQITINGNFKIIGIFQQIGQFSGIIEITRNEIEKYNECVWDQWCHYPRNNIKTRIDWSNKITIKILQDTFDTTACNRDVNFNDFEKYMYIYEIYYLGELVINDI